MPRRSIPAYCANCGAPVPRSAAGRCPSCRVRFAPAGSWPASTTRSPSQSGDLVREQGFAPLQPTGPLP